MNTPSQIPCPHSVVETSIQDMEPIANHESKETSNMIAPSKKIHRLLKDERGLSSVEYVILLVMIVVGAVATWKNIGTNIKEGLGKAESDSQLITEGTGN